MHLEFLVEGQSERTALEPLLKKILGEHGSPHTWRIHKHRGLGKLPSNTIAKPNPRDATLLHNLPAKLRAYGKSNVGREVAVVVLVDLDDRPDCIAFKNEMIELLTSCDPKPKVLFRIAMEELEAWYLGDQAAILQVYPRAKIDLMKEYQQDSSCGTWEYLAESTYPGGLRALKRQGTIRSLQQKRIWARDITPAMDIERNQSPSFQCFRDGVRRLVE